MVPAAASFWCDTPLVYGSWIGPPFMNVQKETPMQAQNWKNTNFFECMMVSSEARGTDGLHHNR